MEKKYEVKEALDKADAAKDFFLSYAEQLCSAMNDKLHRRVKDIPDDVLGVLNVEMPDIVLTTMNNWLVFPRHMSKEYHFDVYLSSKDSKNYLGLYTVKAFARPIAYELAVKKIAGNLMNTMPNMKFVDDMRNLLVIESADKTWISIEHTDSEDDTVIQHDSFEEAWSYVKHNANSLISS